jgi:hypothetical protein
MNSLDGLAHLAHWLIAVLDVQRRTNAFVERSEVYKKRALGAFEAAILIAALRVSKASSLIVRNWSWAWKPELHH